MDKGFENPEERDWLFCNVFFIIILYYIYLYVKKGDSIRYLLMTILHQIKLNHQMSVFLLRLLIHLHK